MEEIVTLINSVGFPILACFYMAENNRKLSDLIGDLTITIKGVDFRLQNIEKEVKENNE